MGQTPDRKPGALQVDEDGIQFDTASAITPAVDGEIRYVTGQGFKFREQGFVKSLSEAAVLQEYHRVRQDGPFNSTSTTLVAVATITTPSIPAGIYRIEWTAQHFTSATSTRPRAQVLLDGATVLTDVASALGAAVAGVHQTVGGFTYVNLTAGIHTVSFLHSRAAGSGTASVREISLEMWKVG